MKVSTLLRVILVFLSIVLFFTIIITIARSSPRARCKYMITNSVGSRYYTDFYTVEEDCIKFTVAQTDPMVINGDGSIISICGQYTVIENANR